ncbi:MAG: HlyD family efflux transporter periplasmic adaptor subunit [Clostridia bacterium]
MSKIIRFEDLKNKKFEKRHIIYIIFAVIVIYIFYSIFLLVRKPTDTVTINSGVVTLEESATGYIIREEQVLKGNNYKNGLTAIVSEGERAAKGQTIFRYSSGQEDEIKAKIEEVNLKLQDALAKQTVITPTTDIKNLEKQIDEKTQNLRNLTDIHTITEYKKEIEELASKKAKIVGALSQSGAYIQELTKQKEQYEAQLISDSEYITAPVSGVVSYRVDGLEDALSTNDLSNLTEEKLENLGLKTGKIISTSQEARKNNK